MIFNFIWNTLYGWIGVAALVCIAMVAVSLYFPMFRKYAIAVAVVVISSASLYGKGWRDRKALDDARKEKAVKRIQEDYHEIDSRSDTVSDVVKRMRDGSF